MAWSLVSSRQDRLGVNGGTSGALDTTGATHLYLPIATDAGVTLVGGDISDSKGNASWSLKGSTYAYTFGRIHLFEHLTPSVGTGHTVTVTKTNSFANLVVLAFAGGHASPFDQSNGNNTSGATTLQPGSVTPTTDEQLIITAVNPDIGSSLTIDAPFTPELYDDAGQASVTYGIGVAYEIQTTATARNPTWTRGASGGMAAGIWTLKAIPTPIGNAPSLNFAERSHRPALFKPGVAR